MCLARSVRTPPPPPPAPLGAVSKCIDTIVFQEKARRLKRAFCPADRYPIGPWRQGSLEPRRAASAGGLC